MHSVWGVQQFKGGHTVQCSLSLHHLPVPVVLTPLLTFISPSSYFPTLRLKISFPSVTNFSTPTPTTTFF
ncbi:hypothetical protein RIF29_24744 [Crotalaria pallida]|uniref:Uncharacterized protein n=1 Tax=Crotalaria pallida TaxID=3830 RepID=A0AAN9EMK6_CROPI